MMKDKGIIPSIGEIATRENILKELEAVVSDWIKAVGDRQGIKHLSASIVLYGSYALKVYNGKSDLDISVIVPACVSMECDFLVHLRDIVETIPNVRNLKSIQTAKVPWVKFNMWGIDVDMACVRVKATTAPRKEILHEQGFCLPIAADANSRMTLEAIKSNWMISECVQANIENFVKAACFLKYWADRRGIYGNINCFIGGTHLVVMVAYICKAYQSKSFAGIISCFFATFSRWEWADPVLLYGDSVQRPFRKVLISIQNPGTNTLCSSNVTNTTLKKICFELLRGYKLTRVLSNSWSTLLDEFPYENYQRFIRVHISVTDGEKN